LCIFELSELSGQVDHSKSQPTDDKPSLKGAWSRHVIHMTHFEFLVPCKISLERLTAKDFKFCIGYWLSLWIIIFGTTKLSLNGVVAVSWPIITARCSRVSVFPSVRPSRQYCVKTAKRRITETTPHDSQETFISYAEGLDEIRTGVQNAECRWGRLK